MTFRMAGHYVGDAQQYRSKDELAAIREKCPIERLKRHLMEQGVKQDELDTIGERAKQEVQQAVDAARAAPGPDATTVLEPGVCGRRHWRPSAACRCLLPVWVRIMPEIPNSIPARSDLHGPITG